MTHAAHRDALLHAAPHEHLHEPVEQRVAALVHALHHGLIHFGDTCDLAGELLIPKLPAEPGRQFFRDGAAARAIFALDGDGANHVWASGLFYAYLRGAFISPST